MTEAKRPLSVRLPLVIYQKLESQSEETGLSLTEVVISVLGAAVGEAVATPGDRLTALEREVGELRGKLRSLASS
jgi:hypothetical protein